MANQYEEDFDISMTNNSLFVMENVDSHGSDDVNVINNSLFELDPLSRHYLSMDVSGMNQTLDTMRSSTSEVPDESSLLVDTSSRLRSREPVSSSLTDIPLNETESSITVSQDHLSEASETTSITLQRNSVSSSDQLDSEFMASCSIDSAVAPLTVYSKSDYPCLDQSSNRTADGKHDVVDSIVQCSSLRAEHSDRSKHGDHGIADSVKLTPTHVRGSADSSSENQLFSGTSESSVVDDDMSASDNQLLTQDLEISSSSAHNQSSLASAFVTADTSTFHNSGEQDTCVSSGEIGAMSSLPAQAVEMDQTDHTDGYVVNNAVSTSDYDSIVQYLDPCKQSDDLVSIESQNDMIAMLKTELENRRSDLEVAAKIGQNLLQSNTDLQKEINNLMKEMSAKVEALEQERYTLQNKLDQKTHMELVLVEDIEMLKLELKHQKQSQDSIIESEHAIKITKMRDQLASQQMELEQSQLSCRQLKNRCTELEEMLKDARDQINQKVGLLNETSSEELAQLHSEVNGLQNEKISLLHELNEAQCNVEQNQHSMDKIRQLLQSKEHELEDKQCQMTSYYNMLEKAREEIQELKVLLDLAKMESQNRNTKGNSLFSEVEDRRVKAEKELISLKVNCESLKKELKIVKQREFWLKTQLALLLRKATKTADLNHMERLQKELSYARSEIISLHNEVNEMEKVPQKQDAKVQMYDVWHREMNPANTDRMKCFEEVIKKKDIGANTRKLRLKRGWYNKEKGENHHGHSSNLCHQERNCIKALDVKEKLFCDNHKLLGRDALPRFWGWNHYLAVERAVRMTSEVLGPLGDYIGLKDRWEAAGGQEISPQIVQGGPL
ncbi:hypothetical protein LSH36_223g00016 [Paralvinella palmiformis]|uniref:HAP1 N-terminal domain-containing protein n=1 Tax=Paralvinella palmiformis TaxID=53620 RepID=A0AAD9JP46_9ANNE|nr:hypothetical protein LSH36_223g00016 [Paralvinella palmiformis]